MRELLLGCGNRKEKILAYDEDYTWKNVTTCDIDPQCDPEILCDLNETPWPFESDSYDEIHAYEVLEHLGKQGDFKSFFDHFFEIWRILKPDGRLYASVPGDPSWIWGDPGHTRYIGTENLTFLSQYQYEQQVGKTSMTDYRWYWKGNFEVESVGRAPDQTLFFILKKLPAIEGI